MDKIPSDDEDFRIISLTPPISEDQTNDLTDQEHTSADKPGSTECSDITASDSPEATGYSHGAPGSSHSVSEYDSHAYLQGCNHDLMQHDHDRAGSIQSTSEHPSGVTPYAHDEPQCSNNPAENISDDGLLDFNPAGTEFKHGGIERDYGVTKTSGYIGDLSTYSNDTDDMFAQGMTTRHSTTTHGTASTHDDASDHVDTSGDTHTLITDRQQEDQTCPMHSNPHQYKESSEKDKGMDKDENFIGGKRDRRRKQPHWKIRKVFRSDSDLKQHSAVSADEKALASTTRGKTLQSRSSDHHTLIPAVQKLHECKYCHTFFKSTSDLNTHIKIHTGEKPCKCQYCAKVFRQTSDLNVHIRSHTGEKPYKCNYCPRFFTEKANLGRHILIHTGEKPYECKHCSKSFRRKSHLNIHIRIHTGEKPYKCQYCAKVFRQISDLNVHIRTHTGEKPYKCNYCPRFFTEKANLGRHILIHTGEKPYECKHCSKSFRRKSSLDKHTRTHTGEQQSSQGTPQTHVLSNNSDSNP